MQSSIFKNIAKITVVAALLWWMLSSGRLNFGELRIFIDQPEILFLSIGLWVIGPTTLGSLRWQLLLRSAGYRISWGRAMILQVAGFFFNSAMPGSVGGDVIKVYYVVKDEPALSKTTAMMTVIMDRVLGLCGLFLMGYTVMLVTGLGLLDTPAIKAQFLVMTSVTVGMAIFLAAFLFPYQEGKDPFLRMLAWPVPGASMFRKLYLAFRVFHDKKMAVLVCVLISFVIQFLGFLLFAFITKTMIHFSDLSALSIFYPLGILTTALPLAPGGIGVGHVAFDRLFQTVGVHGGANVFNVYILGQLALNLTGFIPYLLLRKTSGQPQDKNGGAEIQQPDEIIPLH